MPGGRKPKHACECVCAGTPVAGPAPRAVVTLVHGTFAKHAKWMQPGSTLRQTLDADDVLVQCFCWSGRNRHRDRTLAGYALQDRLEANLRHYPHAEQHVIAHSHGGNVALYALADDDDQYLPQFVDVQLTTLATPFLSFKPVPMTKFAQLTLATILIIAAAALADIYFTIFDVGYSEEYGSTFVWSTLFALTFAYPLSAWLYVGRWLGLAKGMRFLFGDDIDQELVRLSTARSSPNALVVLGAGDEASDLLGAVRLVSWVGHSLMNLTVAQSRIVGALIGLLYAPSFYSAPVDGGSTMGLDIATAILAVPLFALLGPVLRPVFRFFIMIFFPWPSLAFGPDSLFLSLHAITSVSVSPHGYANVLIAEPHGELTHGLYENPAVLEAIRVRLGGELPPAPTLEPRLAVMPPPPRAAVVPPPPDSGTDLSWLPPILT